MPVAECANLCRHQGSRLARDCSYQRHAVFSLRSTKPARDYILDRRDRNRRIPSPRAGFVLRKENTAWHWYAQSRANLDP